MNLSPGLELGFRDDHKNSTELFLSELTNPRSLWYDLRLAEMSGCDYVFAPDAVCRQFTQVRSMQSFYNNIQTILGSAKTRTTVIAYWHDRYRELHFERFGIVWANGVIAGFQKELLDNSPQLDFIRMLFDHSERLIIE